MATDRPFVNSCVAGLTAESVSGTSGALKSRIGGLAYVLTTLRTVTDFEPLQLTIDNEMSDGDTPTWSGEALCVVVGNGRQFAADGTGHRPTWRTVSSRSRSSRTCPRLI